MTEFKNLENAIDELSETVSNFRIGAVSLEDFKPVEEKIRDTRETLKYLNAKVLNLKSYEEYQLTEGEPKEDVRDTVTSLHETTANAHINDNTIKLCLHSSTIQAILAGKEGDQEMQKKIYACMQKLFSLNDSILSLQREVEEASQKQLELKIECQRSLFEYRNHLKEQEKVRRKELLQTNPLGARSEDKINSHIKNINLMKKLMVNLIAASHEMLSENPFLVDMLKKHKELISMETISKMVQQGIENETEHGNK